MYENNYKNLSVVCILPSFLINVFQWSISQILNFANIFLQSLEKENIRTLLIILHALFLIGGGDFLVAADLNEDSCQQIDSLML